MYAGPITTDTYVHRQDETGGRFFFFSLKDPAAPAWEYICVCEQIMKKKFAEENQFVVYIHRGSLFFERGSALMFSPYTLVYPSLKCI